MEGEGATTVFVVAHSLDVRKGVSTLWNVKRDRFCFASAREKGSGCNNGNDDEGEGRTCKIHIYSNSAVETSSR